MGAIISSSPQVRNGKPEPEPMGVRYMKGFTCTPVDAAFEYNKIKKLRNRQPYEFKDTEQPMAIHTWLDWPGGGYYTSDVHISLYWTNDGKIVVSVIMPWLLFPASLGQTGRFSYHSINH